jgi:hypothetical protein
MNIFYLDENAQKCAQDHVDSHSVKMILEYCQLLCTAHRVLDGKQYTGKTATGRNVQRWSLPDDRNIVLYVATHVNHPSAIWVRQSKQNYLWLHELLSNLCVEYTLRYGRIHKCQAIGLVETLKRAPRSIESSVFTPPTPAMPDECKIGNDVIASYRNYYNTAKSHLASWKGRPAPDWFVNTGVTNAHI